MPAPLRRLPRPLPAFLSFLHAGPHPDPRCSHLRSAPGRPGDAAPLRLFTTMKQLRPPLYPPPRPAPAALPNWPPRRPPRLSSAIGGLDRPDSKSPLFIRCLRRLSLRSGPVRAPSERHCQSGSAGGQSEWEDFRGAGLMRVSGRALGSFTTFLPRPPRAGQRAPGSWSCAHIRLCLLRVASGRREGTINTARPGSETERRDPRAAAQPLFPLEPQDANGALLYTQDLNSTRQTAVTKSITPRVNREPRMLCSRSVDMIYGTGRTQAGPYWPHCCPSSCGNTGFYLPGISSFTAALSGQSPTQ
ncbi:uncharacterized protein LOC118652673 [Myotis myotis]|nr:uncharacterized protein LOC118652673 [Myotis myotis]